MMLQICLLSSFVIGADNPFAKSDGQVFTLLAMPTVQRELGLSPNQIQQVKALQNDHGAALRQIHQKLGWPTEEVARNLVREARAVALTEVDEKGAAILDPEQQVRLLQLWNQYRAREANFSFGMLSESVRDKLKLTPKQVKVIEDRAAKHEVIYKERLAEYKKKFAAVRERGDAFVMEVLNEKQRTEYDEVFGPPFYCAQWELTAVYLYRQMSDADPR